MTMEQNAQPIRVAQMMTDMNYGGVEMVVMNFFLVMALIPGPNVCRIHLFRQHENQFMPS